VNCQIFGDPKSLELSLHDLHPASWSVICSTYICACHYHVALVVCRCVKLVLNFRYCVAWYPIYRIPDGKLQAAFLTYHSLGHWIGQSSSADEAVILPVIGLQSYNDKVKDQHILWYMVIDWKWFAWFEVSKLDVSAS